MAQEKEYRIKAESKVKHPNGLYFTGIGMVSFVEPTKAQLQRLAAIGSRHVEEVPATTANSKPIGPVKAEA